MTSHGWKVGRGEAGTHTQTPLLHQPCPSLPVSLPDSDRSPPGCGAAKTRPAQLPRRSVRRSLFHLHLGAERSAAQGSLPRPRLGPLCAPARAPGPPAGGCRAALAGGFDARLVSGAGCG